VEDDREAIGRVVVLSPKPLSRQLKLHAPAHIQRPTLLRTRPWPLAMLENADYPQAAKEALYPSEQPGRHGSNVITALCNVRTHYGSRRLSRRG
jgi:hypothetical protein